MLTPPAFLGAACVVLLTVWAKDSRNSDQRSTP
jgi:hypothetical protein